MRDKRKKGKMDNMGDKIAFFTYDGNCSDLVWRWNEKMEVFVVGSVLNFQRQYIACQLLRETLTPSPLMNEIMGTSITKEEAGSDPAMSVAVSAPTSANIDLPVLNDAQEQAAREFLFSRDRLLHIVQG